MTAWDEYMKEKRLIDTYVHREYRIVGVREHLNGMDVLFGSSAGTERLLVTTADARKYVSGLVIVQQKKA